MAIVDNEQVYDEQIAPLMAQVIAICKQHGVPLVATFQLTPSDEEDEVDEYDGAMYCTTTLVPDGAGELIFRLYHALGHVEPEGVGGVPLPRTK